MAEMAMRISELGNIRITNVYSNLRKTNVRMSNVKSASYYPPLTTHYSLLTNIQAVVLHPAHHVERHRERVSQSLVSGLNG